jgi:hypothetical protein
MTVSTTDPTPAGQLEIDLQRPLFFWERLGRTMARRPATAAFLLAFAIALLFALYTQHAWEDYYITYRASKNLALGNGLVFTPGQRVHSFTSPFNVLLPALFSFAVGNTSDDAALWLYRMVCIVSFAGAMFLLVRAMQSLGWPGYAMALGVGLLTLDAKTVDFTINGQEVGLMLLFLAMTMHALFSTNGRLRLLRLAAAWAGLMWTRPDGMVYGLALASAAWLFAAVPQRSRTQTLTLFAQAGLLAFSAYLPWLAFATWYYGSPLPHSMIAKSFNQPFTGMLLFSRILNFGLNEFGGNGFLRYIFMPVYSYFGGWPLPMSILASVLAWIAFWYWLVPGASAAGRAASLAFAGSVFYLAVIAATPEPWYLPSAQIMACWALGDAIRRLIGACQARRPGHNASTLAWARLIVGAPLVMWALALLTTAIQMDARQQIIEDGNRRQIGLWLRENAASPHDTVFIECLGYVGYFSGLKMYDFPGLSSPEVVAVRRSNPGISWAGIVTVLAPDWVVLRPHEAADFNRISSTLLRRDYTLAMRFDVSARIAPFASFMGSGYTLQDSQFLVFKRVAPKR